MPFLPICVFCSLFLVFSSQTLFGFKNQSKNEQADSAEDNDKIVAIDLVESDFANVIADYLKSQNNQ